MPPAETQTIDEVDRTKSSGESIEKSLFERFLALTRLSYVASCILLTLVLGIPGTLLTRFIDSRDLAQTISIPGIETGSEPYWRAVAFYWIIAYLLFFFYLFYFVRYLRMKVITARARLSPMLAGGEETYNRIFMNISSSSGAIITTILVGLIFSPGVYKLLINSVGPASAAHVIISQGILDFAAGTGIWLFFSSIWSLHKLAKEPMKLESSSEDPFFGLSSIGPISLALTLVFFGALGLRGLGILASGVEITPRVITLVFELGLTSFGFIMFFLAIRSFHHKMVDQKRLEESKLLGQRIASQDSAEKLLLLDIMERRLEKTHTWPFDKNTLNNISAVMLSVSAIMIARIIVVAANL